MIRWGNPFPWYHAWEGYADAGRAVEPAGGRAAGELIAEVGSKVVAVLCEEVVGGAEEDLRGLLLSVTVLMKVGVLDTSCMMAFSSASGRNEKPCSISCLNVPPGGS
jgi:hypothetical protein